MPLSATGQTAPLLERSPVDAPSHLFEVTKVPYLIDLHPDTLL
jgi:hypothetical protein